MKDRKLRKYIHYMLLCGLSLVVFFALLFLIFGGIWGKISLGVLLSLPPMRLLTEVYGFSKTKSYGFVVISIVLLTMLFVEVVFLG